ncbi:GNAT family N-acetyltransferase [Luteitalea pratensis]|nr:GNAT family N-acetyltransferase [Luteitalea pratensis]
MPTADDTARVAGLDARESLPNGPPMKDAALRIAIADTDADVSAVAALFRAYASSIGVDLNYQGFDAELATLPGQYAAPAGVLLLARRADGEPLGCVGLRRLQGDVAEMKRLYVSPAARGLGLGRALLDAVLAAAGDLDYAEVRLDTLPTMHAAIAMYRSAGFTAVAPYYDTAPAGTLFFARRIVG